ncbi:MAG: hypothetical protein EFT35_06385 [Methanophagales archaeon ANME-1-THS]|nr:MAG: hypothetical protein EFT35_06385 [Methanophagales archaeon ANME-1-THS]
MKKRSRLVLGLSIAFDLAVLLILLVVVSVYTDIPQLEPVRKQVDSFKAVLNSFSAQAPEEIVTKEPHENVTIEEILRDPELYNGRIVTTQGRLIKSTNYPYKETPEGEKLWYALNDRNFVISIVPPLPATRTYNAGETYHVKGRVKYIETREYMSTKAYTWEIALVPHEMTKIS